MKMILLIGLLWVGLTWCLDVESLLAAQLQSGHSQRQTIVASDFKQAIFSALTRKYGRRHHRVSVRILFPKKPLVLPAGKLDLEIEKMAGGARTGRRSFRIGLFLNGQFMKTINVVGEVKVQATVVAPTRWMKPKEVVLAEDVTAITVDMPSLTHDFILNQEDVIGKKVLRPLSPRKPIRKIMLDDPPIVHKGDRVMIEVRKGGLLVQAIGLAKADGKSGDTIPVQNKNSGRELIGTILSAGLVEVGF
jgi:flagella basal body P-ring formation protein FlgA